MKPQLHNFPFSRRGSWFSLFRKNPDGAGGHPAAALSLRVVAGVLWEQAEIFDLEIERAGEVLQVVETLMPELLVLQPAKGAGSVRFAFQDAQTLRIRTEGLTLRLHVKKEQPLRLGAAGWAVRAGSCGWVLLAPVEGSLESEGAAFRLDGESAELLLHRTTCGSIPPRAAGTFEECASASQRDFEAWEARFPAVAEEFSALRLRELWTLWNLAVHPLVNFRREVVLASKSSLVGLWSWDHCWHMLGLASIDPDLAWSNLLAVFDHQDALGALPDVMTANQLVWGYLKPPVHGWMLGLLEKRHTWFGDAHRREIYPALANLTDYWLRQRDEDGDGVPNYLHGYDSGWDNATVFDAGFPLESPDLATWLVLQQDWLAGTARRLGYDQDAAKWERGAHDLLSELLNHFWTGKSFVARSSGTHEPVPSDSLLLRIPLLLGRRLPEAAQHWCLDGLLAGGRYRCPFGLLTEPKDSPDFEADGYWRGPMWPVEVFIFVEALHANGLAQEANALALDFLRHVNAAGNFENYRGDNGQGVRDVALAWTSTCILSLLETFSTDDADKYGK